MFLLDTNVVSELRKGKSKADPQVVAWSDSTPAATRYLSAISILELEIGVISMARRDGAQAAMLRSWLDERVLPAFAGRILPVDQTVAQYCARLHVPDPRPERDALIAATAIIHGMPLVTRNVRDFASLGVTLINPWEPRR